MKEKDKRTKVTNEIFNQIKFIKVNSWEENFYDKLDQARESELTWVRRRYQVIWGQILSSWSTPVLVTNATFAWFTLTGNRIDAQTAFIIISMFAVLQDSMGGLPDVITTLIETQISLKRLSDFLNTDEVQDDFITKLPSTPGDEYAVELSSGNFFWGKEPKDDKNQAAPKKPCLKALCDKIRRKKPEYTE